MKLPFFRHHGLLGLNARNLLYIKPFNPRKAIAFADDKLKTKAYLAARGIPVAKIYARIESRKQLRAFDFSTLPDECVLKPNYGSGGEGILILQGRRNGMFLEQGKRIIPQKQLMEHIEDILDGKFSVNGHLDTAFFEKILKAHECLAPFHPAGLPDIRIVVFNLVPVMAMLRIPTAGSRGKANVHLGGIGIGIDIAKGVTTYATQYNKTLPVLPHGASPQGIAIPAWNELLLIASRIQYLTNIGYLAVDLTFDREQGPVLLEVNARAGLMVQVANLAPLRTRLERIEGLPVSSPERGVRIGQDLFGEKLPEKERREAPSHSIVGTREILTIPTDSAYIEIPCLIEPQQERTTFAEDLLQELQKQNAVEMEDPTQKTFRVKIILKGKKIQTVVRAGAMPKKSVRAVVGRRDLQGFLIDPSEQTAPALIRMAAKENLFAADKALAKWDGELLPLKYLKPINLVEERERLEKDRMYNPLFMFPPLPENIDLWEKRIGAITTDESPLGHLLRRKQQEILLRIALLRTRGFSQRFTETSKKLFGEPTEELRRSALDMLASRSACDLPQTTDVIPAEKSVPFFEEALQKCGLHTWKVILRPTLVGDCTIGKKRLYVRKNASFTAEHLAILLIHEIETHAMIAENGMGQPFHIFRCGFANYLDTQEGLAIFNQNRILSQQNAKRFSPARTVLAIQFALHHSFAETRRYTEEELGYTPEKALTKTLQMKRGIGHTEEPGAFTKGIVYFRGVQAIEKFVAEGGNLRRLYIGRIAIEDIDAAEKIPGVKPPVFLPSFLLPKELTKERQKKKPQKRT